MTTVDVNGRRYRVPDRPTVVACLDGLDPSYLDDALLRGLLPRVTEMIQNGAAGRGRAQVPTFTNPNNLSIVHCAPPIVHGVPGNHHLAPDGRQVQLTDPSVLRSRSIHAELHAAGVPVLCVTTKDKLRRLLGDGDVPAVSAELAHEQRLDGIDSLVELVGRPNPSIYDPECSLYAFDLALALQRPLDALLVYVSTTDYVQHAHAPGTAVSDAFLRGLDQRVGALLDAGFDVGLVADHGMNDKAGADGAPRVRHLTETLGRAGVPGEVVLPITDPYVVHHAALGSACFVHVDETGLEAAREAIGNEPGVEEVLGRDEAAARFSLPADRIGDLFVLADAGTVLGARPADHDLSALHGRLRSHGGLHEQTVPILLSRAPDDRGAALLASGEARNSDVHHLLLGAS